MLEKNKAGCGNRRDRRWCLIFYFWPCCKACRILVPPPGTEPTRPLQWQRGVLTTGLLGSSEGWSFRQYDGEASVKVWLRGGMQCDNCSTHPASSEEMLSSPCRFLCPAQAKWAPSPLAFWKPSPRYPLSGTQFSGPLCLMNVTSPLNSKPEIKPNLFFFVFVWCSHRSSQKMLVQLTNSVDSDSS